MADDSRALTYSEMRNQSLFTDAVVKSSSGREWNLHKVVMSRTSRFFSNAFTFPSFSGILDLGVGDDIVQIIIDLAYEDMICEVNMDNVLEIFSAALMYQIQSLIDICVSLVFKNAITFEKVLDLKVFMRHHQVPLESFTDGTLIQTVDKFIRRNFTDFYDRDEVYKLSVEDLEDYIKEDDLNMAEEELLDFVLKYSAFHQLNTQKAKQLLSHVRILLIDPKVLQKITTENPTYRTEIETSREMNASQSPRYPRDIILVTGGSEDGENGKLEIFNIRKNEWKQVSIQANDFSPQLNVGNILYEIEFLEESMVGWIKIWTKIRSLDLKNGHSVTEKYSELPHLMYYTNNINLLSWNGGILAFISNPNVAYYNPEDNSWTRFPCTNGDLGVVVNGNLFSLGKEIEYFDNGTKTWILCGHLKEKTPYEAKFVDGKVYLFSLCEEYAECFQPVWKEGRMNIIWFSNIQLNLSHNQTSTAVVDRRILFTGGHQSDKKEENYGRKKCHIFSPRTGEWYQAADLHGSKFGHRAITVNTSDFNVDRIKQICDGEIHFSDIDTP